MKAEGFDAPGRARYPAARSAGSWPAGGVVGAACLAIACAPSMPPATELPRVDGLSIAASLQEGTRVESPTLIRFGWSLSEQGSRGGGSGVARVEPPYRARLDLFLENGTTVARATLLGGVLWLPPGVPADVIPPPDLLWAALGVFRPGEGMELLGARRRGDEVELRYGDGGGRELRYRIEAERLHEVDLLERGSTVHSVSLVPRDAEGYPGEATYRNLGAFRELKLTTRSIEHVDAFSPEIWSPEP